MWHKLTCHSCRSSEGSGLQLPPLGHQNLPVVGQCQQQLLQSCLRRRGGKRGKGEERPLEGDEKRLNCGPRDAYKEIGI